MTRHPALATQARVCPTPFCPNRLSAANARICDSCADEQARFGGLAAAVTDADRRNADALLRNGTLPTWAKTLLGRDKSGDAKRRYNLRPELRAKTVCNVKGCGRPRAKGRAMCAEHQNKQNRRHYQFNPQARGRQLGRYND